MKWICRFCHAINPEFSYKCHCCGEEYIYMSLSLPEQIENKTIDEIRDEGAQVYCDTDVQRVYRNGFNASTAIWKERTAGLVEALELSKKILVSEFGNRGYEVNFKHINEALSKYRSEG